jgi:rod shape-determining protein MreC
MESFLNRYRSITVLLLVIFAQLVLLAVQVKNDKDMRMIRVWTVTAITPVARIVEAVRGGGAGLLRDYVTLRNTDAENRRLTEELNRYKLENIFLKNELATADRAKALQVFQSHTPSKTLAATVFGIGTGSNSKVVFVDRGSVSGVQRGMAVVTPDGIVGKVKFAYPASSEVLLATDPDFAAGVVSQKNQARGTLKGQGTPMCLVDYVPFEEKVELGEWFFTSGDDRIFPRGLPVGVVRSVRNGPQFKEISLDPSGLQRGVEDVLIIVEGVHMEIPDTPPSNQPVYIAPPPPAPASAPAAAPPSPVSGPATEADKLRLQYKAVGEAQKKVFGVGLPGSTPPDFTKLGQAPAPSPAAVAPAPGAVKPPGPVAPAAGNAAPPNSKPPAADAPKQLPPPDALRRANQAAGASTAPKPAGQAGSPPPK